MRHITSLAGGLALLAVVAGGAFAQTAATQTAVTQTGPAQAIVPALTTGVLAALCGATGGDAESATAVGYCRGFIIGVGQYAVAMSRPGGIRPVFCLPTPSPTQDVAQASFVAWAAANPQYTDDKAVDGLLRWAAATYPCAAAPRRAAQR